MSPKEWLELNKKYIKNNMRKFGNGKLNSYGNGKQKSPPNGKWKSHWDGKQNSHCGEAPVEYKEKLCRREDDTNKNVQKDTGI